MSDKEIIETTARLWISLGGDAEGLDYCYCQLKDKINEYLKIEVI